jgi:type VI secretion system protein VasG
MENKLEQCIQQLNSSCLKALGAASAFCISNMNKEVEPEHLLFKLLDLSESEFERLLHHFSVDPEKLKYELNSVIENFETGHTETPVFSDQIYQLLISSQDLLTQYPNETKIHPGTIFWAYMKQLSQSEKLNSLSIMKRILASHTETEIKNIVISSIEKKSCDHLSAPQENFINKSKKSKQSNIDKYCIDLVARAKSGLIDPVYGREKEIRQITNILTRRRHNNPVLTGEAGVGKTAIVEGLAVKIVNREVPEALNNTKLIQLDLAMLLAGAGIRGEFEKRLKSLISEIKNAAQPVIVFIDEVHSLMGAGGNAGTGDAANILKPALAREEFRLIGATTNSEYKKHIEKDPALIRRFQQVNINEPDEKTTEMILNHLVKKLEQHHGVMVMNEAITDAVKLSKRYITERKLPDKAINILDAACARVVMSQLSTPPQIERICKQIEQNDLQLNLLKREHTSNHDNLQLHRLQEDQKTLRSNKKTLEIQLEKERKQVNQMIAIQKKMKLAAEISEIVDIDRLRQDYFQLQHELKAIQKQNALVFPHVDSECIASVISEVTGIPLGKMLTNEINDVLNLQQSLKQRIIGQDNAIDFISKKIKSYKANINNPKKPAGVFLLTGPSGIGKTETAECLAQLLFGENHMITLNMTEYKESHTISAIKGAPPGYVGHDKGGGLTEAVRRNPYSLILLDEFEKAHSDVKELFYQVFDKGVLEDSEGHIIDFKNTLIILTSNTASKTIINEYQDSKGFPDYHSLLNTIRPQLIENFKSELLGRLTVVPYLPLSDEHIREIVILKLKDLNNLLLSNHNLNLSYTDSVIDYIAEKCTQRDTGARHAEYIIEQELKPDLSEKILCCMAREEPIPQLSIQLNQDNTICIT